MGSAKGAGLYPEMLPGGELTSDRHCLGNPVNVLLTESKPVWTLWTKLEGGEIFSFFLRLIKDIILYDCKLLQRD